jgi:hypothetical protein
MSRRTASRVPSLPAPSRGCTAATTTVTTTHDVFHCRNCLKLSTNFYRRCNNPLCQAVQEPGRVGKAWGDGSFQGECLQLLYRHVTAAYPTRCTCTRLPQSLTCASSCVGRVVMARQFTMCMRAGRSTQPSPPQAPSSASFSTPLARMHFHCPRIQKDKQLRSIHSCERIFAAHLVAPPTRIHTATA